MIILEHLKPDDIRSARNVSNRLNSIMDDYRLRINMVDLTEQSSTNNVKNCITKVLPLIKHQLRRLKLSNKVKVDLQDSISIFNANVDLGEFCRLLSLCLIDVSSWQLINITPRLPRLEMLTSISIDTDEMHHPQVAIDASAVILALPGLDTAVLNFHLSMSPPPVPDALSNVRNLTLGYCKTSELAELIRTSPKLIKLYIRMHHWLVELNFRNTDKITKRCITTV
ncbi:unnamed protein product [Didymodactylos carnosus]|uniref:F-box domain-containing protein n=1 Tax=Didymodactylos carnosus TaxID=1234261 RepID=A0A8S2XAE9_9BILA|nr:unnamed protein product [Didymodactylos carnosus]